jgi:predicted dehydrogenase
VAQSIRVGIVGSGARSGAHARAFLDVPGVEVVAFCDIVRERAESRAAEFGAAGVYEDYRALIHDGGIEVVSVCASNELHAEVAIEAAQSGMHVLVEKPMAQSLRECDEMIAAARRNGVKLAVNFQSRFFPRSHWIRELLATGRLGDAVVAKGYGWTIHVWDTIQWMMGEPLRVSAEWSGEQRIYRDPLLATVRFASGHLGFMQASAPFHEPVLSEKQHYLSFVGNRATASYGLWANELTLGAREAGVLAELDAARQERFGGGPLLAGGVPDIPDFIRAIREDGQPTVPGEEGRKSVEFVTGVYKAALSGQMVEFPIASSDPAYADPGRPVSA